MLVLGDGELLVELLPLHWDGVDFTCRFSRIVLIHWPFSHLKCHVKVVAMANALLSWACIRR